MKNTVEYEQDGNMICAHLDTFDNLQESPAGFGATRAGARTDLVLSLCKDFNKAMTAINADDSR